MKLSSILSQDAHWNINKRIARKIGVIPTLLLMELIFCREKYGQKEFYESAAKLEENLCIGEDLRRSATKTLVDAGIISMVRKGVPAKWYYTIMDDAVMALFDDTSDRETPPLETGKPATSDPVNPVTINKNIIKNKLKNTYIREWRTKTYPQLKGSPPDYRENPQTLDKIAMVNDALGRYYKTVLNQKYAPRGQHYIEQLWERLDPNGCVYDQIWSQCYRYPYDDFWSKFAPNIKNLESSWDKLIMISIPAWIEQGYASDREYQSSRGQTKVSAIPERQKMTNEEAQKFAKILDDIK